MTNRDKYKQAFSAIHISDTFSLEVKNMTTKKSGRNRLIACAAACAMLVGGATAAFAADLGGIQRKLQIWMNGEQTAVTIQFDGNGGYNMSYLDEQGKVSGQGGGGVAIEDDGTERPLTEDELLEDLMAPDVSYEDDGSVWVYWYDQKIDITDKFTDGVCYVKLVNGDDVLYTTVRYQDGLACSPNKYPSPAA